MTLAKVLYQVQRMTTITRETSQASEESTGGHEEPRAHAAQPTNTWLVGLLTLAVFVNFLAALAIGAFLPAMAAELGVSVALLGQVPAVMMLLAAVLGLIIGPLADRFGYRRVLLVGVAALVISTLGIGLSPTYLVMLVVAAAGAVGRAAVLPVGQAILGSRYSEEDAKRAALSKIQTGQSGASVLGIPLLTTIAAFVSWHAAFLALAGLSLIVLVALARAIPHDAQAATGRLRLGPMFAPYRPLLQDRASLALIAAAWFGNGALWLLLTYVAAFYVQQHGFSTQEVGWTYLVCGSGVLFGQLLAGGRIGRKPRALVIWSRIISGVFMGSALFLPIPALATVVVATIGLIANGASNVATVVLLTHAAPTARATTLTVNGSAMSLGSSLGGALGGLLLATGGYSLLGVGTLVLGIISATIVLWWSRAPKAPARESAAPAAA